MSCFSVCNEQYPNGQRCGMVFIKPTKSQVTKLRRKHMKNRDPKTHFTKDQTDIPRDNGLRYRLTKARTRYYLEYFNGVTWTYIAEFHSTDFSYLWEIVENMNRGI